jgi:recombination protein RecR
VRAPWPAPATGADPIARLIRELGRLPGIGEKTATRLAFYVLRAPDDYARELAEALVQVKERIRLCSRCMNLTEVDPCALCTDARRDDRLLCVVASPPDLHAVERTGDYRGRYHVLHGVLSPLDGVGPDELRIRELLVRLAEGNIAELIIATSPNVEGEATALYLAKVVKPLGVRVSRIATGVAVGGELEYADGVTLSRALEGRRPM